MYKRADIMAYAKNHTQKGRFSIQRERERGSRTRRTHFRLYNSYSMRFAQTRKQKSKKVKRNPLAPMTGTRGSHVERRKLHLCSAAHLSAATVSDGSKVLVFTPHRLTRSSSMTPSSLYLLPSIMYYTTNRTFLQVFSQNQAHFVRGYASAATLRPSPAPLSSGSYAIFGGDAVFVRTFCNSIPKSVRISNFLGMRCTKSLNSFAVCPLPFLYGKSTRNVV